MVPRMGKATAKKPDPDWETRLTTIDERTRRTELDLLRLEASTLREMGELRREVGELRREMGEMSRDVGVLRTMLVEVLARLPAKA